MGIDTEDDIVQDFLVESREIMEQLGEQLVALEQRPEDTDLLHSVFRGFHTIKGGAGFLGLDPMVEVCHRTEDLFNLLRNGERGVTTDLMDSVLQALDVVNDQFGDLENGDEPRDPPAALLHSLEALQAEEGAAPAAAAAERSATTDTAAAGTDSTAGGASAASDEITDEEFEALLDAMDEPSHDVPDDGQDARAPEGGQDGAAGRADDDITEEEFEAILDQLHGPGQHKGVPETPALPADGRDASGGGAAFPSAPGDDELISDDEFEAVLDQLHGTGKGPSTDRETAAGDDSAAGPPAAGGGTPPGGRGGDEPPGGPSGGDDSRPAAKGGGETSVRVDTAKLDDIMNLVGELVLVRNRLSTIRSTYDDERMSQAVADLELVTSDLQNAVMKTRMQPIKKVFGRFPRTVRDLSRSLGKEVNLKMSGEETDLDKNLVEALADPLIHLVRNAVDHGIESPDERRAAGKPAGGTLRLSAEQEGDHILLTIGDDGKGMDPEALRAKVVDKGLMDRESAARLDDKDCFNLIFMPGFSTKTEISDVSGRGVGMDVVKTKISQLNGTVDIDSELGRGTTLRIKVPLTLAILPTLMVKLQGRKFALPMSVVSEIFELEMERTKVVDGRRVVMVRNRAMPLFFLERWIERMASLESRDAADVRRDQQVVSVTVGNQTVGFVVDDVIGLEEVVIKPLGTMLQGLPGLAGSTITGDGSIALIIDIPSLVKAYGSSM